MPEILGEAAQGVGGGVDGRLQGLQQRSGGDGDVGHCVAEGQNRVNILLGDVAGLNGGADAAAIGQGDYILGGNRQFTVLGGVPQNRIRDQVTRESRVRTPGARSPLSLTSVLANTVP